MKQFLNKAVNEDTNCLVCADVLIDKVLLMIQRSLLPSSFTVLEEQPQLKSCYDSWLLVSLDVKPHVLIL
jgi:hypothetical protein